MRELDDGDGDQLPVRIVVTLWQELPDEYGLRDAARIVETHPELVEGEPPSDVSATLDDHGFDFESFVIRIQPVVEDDD